jgi:hypothetical protein
VFQIVDFISSISDLKFTYTCISNFKNYFRGYNYTPDPHDKGEGRERRERGRKGGKERRGRKGGEGSKGRDGMG